MQVHTQTASPSKKLIWAGRILSGLCVLFLLFDGGVKLFNPSFVVEASGRLGYPPTIGPALGIVLLVCTIIHLILRTSILGAILLTGYLGGAVASHVRIGEGWFPILFPVFFGALLWGGLVLHRSPAFALVPLRS